jgi:hypothetical protein
MSLLIRKSAKKTRRLILPDSNVGPVSFPVMLDDYYQMSIVHNMNDNLYPIRLNKEFDLDDTSERQ